jgi:hypothetical protein
VEVNEDWRGEGSSFFALPFDPRREGVRGRFGAAKKPFKVIGNLGDAGEMGVCVFD